MVGSEFGAAFGITIQVVANAVRGIKKRIRENTKFPLELIRPKEIIAAVK